MAKLTEPQDHSARISELESELAGLRAANNTGVAAESDLERALLQTEKQLRQITDNMTDLIVATNSELAITYVSPSSKRMLGSPPADLIGANILDWVHPDEASEVLHILSEFIERGESGKLELRARHSDGHYFSIEAAGSPILDEGVQRGFLFTARDITRRKQVERDVIAAKEFAENLLETASTIIVTLDINANITTFNAFAEKITGYAKSEVMGRNWFDIFSPADIRDQLPKVFADALNSMPAVSEHENHIITKNGDSLLIKWNNSVQRNNDGNVDGVLSIGMDISEHRRAEDTLRENEERYRLFVESFQGIAYQVEPDTFKPDLFEGTIEQVTGYSPDVFLSNSVNWTQIIHPDEMNSVREQNDALADGAVEISDSEYRIIHKDGSEHWVRDVRRLISRGDRKLIEGTVVDITPRKHAETTLLDNKRQISLLVENMGDMVSRHLPDSTITYVSPSCRDLLGYSAEELIATPSAEIVHPDDTAPTLSTIANAVSEREDNYQLQHRLRHKEGHWVWVETVGKLIYDANGALEEIQCSVRNITERKNSEEENLALERRMQHAQKLESLGVLAGGIAHDFNNLLMAILGNADLALFELPEESPARENIKEIVKASKRAADLARQMLAYSGKGHFVVEPIHLGEMIKEISHLLEVSISKKSRIDYNLVDDLPTFDGDATQIRQIIMNLITNAAEAIGDQNGVINLTTGVMDCDRGYLDTIDETLHASLEKPLPEGPYVFLEVRDSGCGMDEETLERVFDPFFTTKFTGRGLGMSAVLGIVRGHAGALKIESHAGRGSTFRILFPRSTQDPASPETAAPEQEVEQNWRGSGTILLADDEETIRLVGTRMLEVLGFSVIVAADGRKAVELYRKRRDDIACVILDLTMPDMDGEEAYREIRRIDDRVSVVLCSGFTEQDATKRFEGRGLAGFIQKPFDLPILRRQLASIFDGGDPDADD